MHVAAFIESIRYAKASVKLHLTVIRTFFNWFLVCGLIDTNPAAPVRGPKHVVKVGKTPPIAPEKLKVLFGSIPVDTICGLRDRALMGVMLYSFARVGAVIGMNIGDYRKNESGSTFCLHDHILQSHSRTICWCPIPY